MGQLDDEADDSAAMKPRRFRVEDHHWFRGMAKAKREGTTISAKIRGWLIAYVNDDLA